MVDMSISISHWSSLGQIEPGCMPAFARTENEMDGCLNVHGRLP